MADLHPIIETMEHRFMRAWVNGDARELKALTSSNFRMLVGSKPSVLLDATSWLYAATGRYTCSSYRFGDIYVRNVGSVAIFATQLQLTATLNERDWSGQFWVTDLWKKSKIRRNWRMIERVISRPENNAEVATDIAAMQLWRPSPRRIKSVLSPAAAPSAP
jgi:hypothetical protein